MSAQMNNEKKIGIVQECRDNLNLIRRLMNLLKANYGKKREETIEAMQKAGFTPGDIRGIQEKYCGGEDLPFKFVLEHRDEMKSIIARLKYVNEVVIYSGEKDAGVIQKDGNLQTPNSPITEHVEAEIVPEEEAKAMREKLQERRMRKDTDDMISMVNAHHDRVKAERDQKFRRKIADKAKDGISPEIEEVENEDGPRSTSNNRSRTGKRVARDGVKPQRKAKPGKRLDIKNKPKLDRKTFFRRLTAGALAISVIAGAYAIHRGHEYQEDVENRIGYVDDIIDGKGTVQDYSSRCGIDFTDEELDKFLEIEGKIESFAGKKSIDLRVVDIITTAGEFEQLYKDIVRERLEEGFGFSIDEDQIKVVRERDDLDGKPGNYNEHGNISEIGYRSYINDRDLPKELLRSIITAYGGEGIEKPAMSVEQLIYKLDNQEITKAEASKYLKDMLDNMKELMTRRYEEKSYNELEEAHSTYDIVQEQQKEIEKIFGKDGQEPVAHVVDDDELDR